MPLQQTKEQLSQARAEVGPVQDECSRLSLELSLSAEQVLQVLSLSVTVSLSQFALD